MEFLQTRLHAMKDFCMIFAATTENICRGNSISLWGADPCAQPQKSKAQYMSDFKSDM